MLFWTQPKKFFAYYFFICSQIHNSERSSAFLCGTNLNKDIPTSITKQENGGHTQQLKIKCCDDGAREGDKQLMMLYKARHIIDIRNSNTHLQTKTMRQRTSGETLLGLVSSGTLLHLPAAWIARNRQWEHRQSFSLISCIIKHLGLVEAGIVRETYFYLHLNVLCH